MRGVKRRSENMRFCPLALRLCNPAERVLLLASLCQITREISLFVLFIFYFLLFTTTTRFSVERARFRAVDCDRLSRESSRCHNVDCCRRNICKHRTPSRSRASVGFAPAPRRIDRRTSDNCLADVTLSASLLTLFCASDNEAFSVMLMREKQTSGL